jgi:hypothetical protein
MTTFELVLKLDVIPIDNPTVENAEMLSNMIGSSSISGLKTLIRKVELPITKIDRVIIEKARLIVVLDISTFKNSVCCLPLTTLKRFRMATANVLVFIPPPVDPGEAPIHINTKVKSMVAWPSVL